MSFSRFKIYQQDPTVGPIGLRPIALDCDVQPGLFDADIKIISPVMAKPNADGDYLFDPDRAPEAFNAAMSYAVVRQTVDIINRALAQAGEDFGDNGNPWGDEPIEVYPDAGTDANAYYGRSEHALKFFQFEERRTRRIIWTCQSADVVAHETAHWKLDCIQPGWLQSADPDAGAIHEATGDLVAIMCMLMQFDMLAEIMVQTKGDMHAPSFLTAMAEQFGAALGMSYGLRNADNDLRRDQVGDEVHELSQVVTGAVYDIMAEIYAATLEPGKYHPAETLYRAAQHTVAMYAPALFNAPAEEPMIRDIAWLMEYAGKKYGYEGIVRQQFDLRKLLDPPRPSMRGRKPVWAGCCGTMRRIHQ